MDGRPKKTIGICEQEILSKNNITMMLIMSHKIKNLSKNIINSKECCQSSS